MGLTMILKSDMMTIMRMNTTMKRLMSLRKNRQQEKAIEHLQKKMTLILIL